MTMKVLATSNDVIVVSLSAENSESRCPITSRKLFKVQLLVLKKKLKYHGRNFFMHNIGHIHIPETLKNTF